MDAINKRKSIRNFEDDFVNADTLSRVFKIIESKPKTGPHGYSFDFEIIAQNLSGQNRKLSTYGLLTGKYAAIVAWSGSEPESLMDYGYVLENIALDCVDMGLGTCWLGGSLSKQDIIQEMRSDKSHQQGIYALLAFGFKNRQKKIIRNVFFGKKRKRKEFHELFSFDSTDSVSDDIKKYVLDGVRWAPSDMNSQPIRAEWKENRVHFYLTDEKSLLRYVDAGIAMSHFEYRAKRQGFEGSWVFEPKQDHPQSFIHFASYEISKTNE
ncbi:MAG TPA: hypothetical protein DHN33_08850 [Eubacteriaceae bacterium]|nr:hypothetical protein [Eubacteriaceae bacterium]